MRYLQLSVLFVLVAAPLHASLAGPLAPPWDDLRTKHAWNAIPPNWETHGHPPAGTTIDLHIALKHRKEKDVLIDALYEVSEPSSPKYGAHLSREQVAQLVAPHPDTLELIHSWLEHHHIQTSSISTSHGGSWLKVSDVPVPKANEMLGASYQLYQRTGTNDTTILRTIGYTLPAVLHPHVRTVVPTTYFDSPRTLIQTSRKRSVGASAEMASRELSRALSGRYDNDDVITPSHLRSLYRTTEYLVDTSGQVEFRNVLGIVGFQNQYPSPADLREFMTTYRTDAEDATYSVAIDEGGDLDPDDVQGVVAHAVNLNMQYTQAMAYPVRHRFFGLSGAILEHNGDAARGDIFLQWLSYVDHMAWPGPFHPPTLILPYSDYEKNVPEDYANAVCDMFLHLSYSGASFIVPSGNDGVGHGDCWADDGSVEFIPEFPASCPYVTSVGGTTLGTGRQEVAASLSGGGFSNYFERPKYQKDSVPAYLDGFHEEYRDYYNSTGRGIPDISAQALNYVNINNNEEWVTNGTGCAAPTVAGIISLLNDFMISNDQRPLGFLNPWLYGDGLKGINDVTEGSNPGCDTKGFSATRGWDPVTGLGTPDFWTLKRLLYPKNFRWRRPPS